MKLYPIKRKIDADFKEFSIEDILYKLTNENFFAGDQNFQIFEDIDKNKVILESYAGRYGPDKLHLVSYYPQKKKLIIRSYFRLNFRFFLALCYPMSILFFWGWQRINNEFQSSDLAFLSILVFLVIVQIVTLFSDSKDIERAIKIRLNALLREKGYRVKI